MQFLKNTIRTLLTTIVILLLALTSFGQDQDHVKWEFKATTLENGQIEFSVNANLEKGWHLYSQFVGDVGPIPTEIIILNSEQFNLEGKFEEVGAVSEYDKTWETDILFFADKAKFIGKLNKIGSSDTISFNLYCQICDDKQCIQIDENFKVKVDSDEVISENSIEDIDEDEDATPHLENLDLNNPVSDECSEKDEEDRGILMLFILGLLSGLVALVTPCVFPMIPLTVSYFTKGGSERKSGFWKALLYGLSIVAVYVLLSVPFYFGVDSNLLNEIASGAILNFIFFIVFLFFAFSFFGFYELTLPSSWANKADKASDKGGIIGIVFMALVLAIVSFSCTGPLLGQVLAGSLTKGAFPITMAMLGFGVGLGLPFTIFAAFPSLLKSLPQSGGWLNSVKVVLGFLEVALAFKFLSTADLVADWGILKYEVFLVIWILCAIGTSAYLFGIIRFKHDSPIKKYSITRIGFASLFGVLAIYFAFGFRINEKINSYQSLDLLSGIAPPVGYSIFYPLECPNGFECYHDLETGMEDAIKSQKPILIDITGHSCVNCRRMEDNVWSQPEVFNLINDNFILISLYVDDSEELPENEQGNVKIEMAGGKHKFIKIKTVGNKWSAFSQRELKKLSQPYYVLISPEGFLLNNPKAYTPNVTEYANWLKCGLEAYEKFKKGEFSKSNNTNKIELEVLKPVIWSGKTTKNSDGTHTLIIDGLIEKGWHTYSQNIDPSIIGPMPTEIKIEPNDNVLEMGKFTEEGATSHFDPVWKAEIADFSEKAQFKSIIKLKEVKETTLKINIYFMVCNDKECLAPTEEFVELIIKP
jgi:thiol:disulfide interchange protein DsbD